MVNNSGSPKLTTLDYALMGLLAQKPCSGYALRKVFENTPMSSYSSSPGSIYPALKRLQRAGYTARKTPESGAKNPFMLTGSGLKALRAWLTAPIAAAKVDKEYPALALRFAFMSEHLPDSCIADFLDQLAQALSDYADFVQNHLDDHRKAMTPSGRLILECGISEIRGRAAWAVKAQATFASETAI